MKPKQLLAPFTLAYKGLFCKDFFWPIVTILEGFVWNVTITQLKHNLLV
jgi:hypothetical protein